MIADGKVLGVIAARGGSKGLPGKNIRMLAGKPLIVWSIEAGLESKYIDRLILSSDDESIMSVARTAGCDVPFRRAAALAADASSSIDVVIDAVDRCIGYEWVVLLQPTSPLRTVADIDAAIERCVDASAPSCVSVCEAQETPYWMYRETNGRLEQIVAGPEVQRRQDLPQAFLANGAVYVAKIAWLRQHQKLFLPGTTVGYVMPRERSVDIDDADDLRQAEAILLAERSASTART